jgi:hypothetical protein
MKYSIKNIQAQFYSKHEMIGNMKKRKKAKL